MIISPIKIIGYTFRTEYLQRTTVPTAVVPNGK